MNPIIASIVLGSILFQIWLFLNTLGGNQSFSAHMMQEIMKFSMWIKSMLTTGKPCYYERHHYILGIKGRSSWIAIKGLEMITGPSYVAQLAKSDNDTILRDKPLTRRLDSDFFLIGVNNLYLPSHICISIRVMCLFRNQELESSVFFSVLRVLLLSQRI